LTNIILIFLKGFIEDLVGDGGFVDTGLNFAFETLAHNTFFIEDSLGLTYGNTFSFDNIMAFVMGFAITLIILKALKKGFDTNVAWTDDPATDNFSLLTNMIKAMVVALSFPLLYEWLCDVVEEFTSGMLDVMSISGVGMDFADAIIQMISSSGLVSVICILIFLILLIVLYVKFLMRAAELLIIRVGFPLACCGIIDANGGIFSGYVNKMFQTVLSVTVQVVLAKVSILMAIGSHFIWAIAFAILAIKSPNILRDLIYNPGGGGGGISQAYYASQMIRGLIKK